MAKLKLKSVPITPPAKKLKVVWKPNPLDEARTIGFMEGYSDGRNDIITELIKYKLLPRGWKKEYNKRTQGNYLIK